MSQRAFFFFELSRTVQAQTEQAFGDRGLLHLKKNPKPWNSTSLFCFRTRASIWSLTRARLILGNGKLCLHREVFLFSGVLTTRIPLMIMGNSGSNYHVDGFRPYKIMDYSVCLGGYGCCLLRIA